MSALLFQVIEEKERRRQENIPMTLIAFAIIDHTKSNKEVQDSAVCDSM